MSRSFSKLMSCRETRIPSKGNQNYTCFLASTPHTCCTLVKSNQLTILLTSIPPPYPSSIIQLHLPPSQESIYLAYPSYPFLLLPATPFNTYKPIPFHHHLPIPTNPFLSLSIPAMITHTLHVHPSNPSIHPTSNFIHIPHLLPHYPFPIHMHGNHA